MNDASMSTTNLVLAKKSRASKRFGFSGIRTEADSIGVLFSREGRRLIRFLKRRLSEEISALLDDFYCFYERTMGYSFDAQSLVASLRASGAWVSDDAFTLSPIEGMGIGALAARDIKPHEPLFHLPLSYLLTPWTSSLRTKLSEEEWEQLDKGWLRLMTCMMWEESLGAASPWHGYLANMPREFDSPMFWSESDKAELIGTDIERE